MILWLRAILAGLMGGICAAAVLTSTSGELQSLVAFDIPGLLQIPGLILVGLLVGLVTPDLGRGAAAYLTALLLAAPLHVLLYALPGFETANYTTARFNNGFSTSLFVFLIGGIFLLVGQGAAIAINVFVRGIYD